MVALTNSQSICGTPVTSSAAYASHISLSF
jgi:hypothetical protein